eukprot:748849-Hanusia_phi.AAC.1
MGQIPAIRWRRGGCGKWRRERGRRGGEERTERWNGRGGRFEEGQLRRSAMAVCNPFGSVFDLSSQPAWAICFPCPQLSHQDRLHPNRNKLHQASTSQQNKVRTESLRPCHLPSSLRSSPVRARSHFQVMRLFTALQAICVVISSLSLVFLANVEAAGGTSKSMAVVATHGLVAIVVGSAGDVLSFSATIFLEKDWIVRIDKEIRRSKHAKLLPLCALLRRDCSVRNAPTLVQMAASLRQTDLFSKASLVFRVKITTTTMIEMVVV